MMQSTRRNRMRCRWVAMTALLLLLAGQAKAQVAGMSTLSVLDMSSVARTAGLGMDYLSVWNNDMGVGIDNPSLIDKRFGNSLSFDFVGMFEGTKMGSVYYCLDKSRFGTFIIGLKYNSYGSFDGYDENEVSQGSFSAADYMIDIGWGLHIDSNFSIGANFKPIFSQYESYSALAFAFDLAGSYVSDSKQFSSTLMARNIGAQIMTFDNTTESLPFELSAAMSYKLENAPFRFHLALTELQKWNLRYEDSLDPSTTTDLFTGEVTTQSGFAKFSDNMFRHINLGLELNLGKAFYATLGYGYRRSAETRSTSLTSINTSGFSFGIGFKIKGFNIAYARNNYYLGKAPNYISITTSLDRFLK